jgi:hypothetical protein
VQSGRIHRLAHYQSRLTKLCCYAWHIDFDVGHGRYLSRKIQFGKHADMNPMRHPVMVTYLACLNPTLGGQFPYWDLSPILRGYPSMTCARLCNTEADSDAPAKTPK